MNLSKELLVACNRKGFFPLESEDECAFRRRYESSVMRKCSLSHPIDIDSLDLSLENIQVSFASMRPWHKGYVELAPSIPPKIVLNKRSKSTQDVLFHECIHICREPYLSSPYEEILAHILSPSPWRYRWGALFQTRLSCIFLLFFTAMQLSADLFLQASNAMSGVVLSSCMRLALPLFLCIEVFRAWQTWQKVNKVRKKLAKISPLKRKDAFLIRLSPSEITSFADLTAEQIYQKISRGSTFRDQFFRSLYFQ